MLKVIYYSLLFVILTVSSFNITSCTTNETINISCNGTSVKFSEANPIIQANCATTPSCHAAGSTRGPGPLVTYSQIFAAKNAIKTTVANGEMPQGATLSNEKRNAIVCWIENGAVNN
jgi:hypothetical protein